MSCNHGKAHCNPAPLDLSRRAVLQATAASLAMLAVPRDLLAALAKSSKRVAANRRFPYFRSTPVSYFNVKLQDSFWAPRQKIVREVSVPWAVRHFDAAGGVETFRANSNGYQAQVRPGDMEAIKFIEAMAAVVGVERDAAVEGLTRAWGRKMIAAQDTDGYWPFGWPLAAEPAKRWRPLWWSHEDYALGHYLESAIAFRESTGDTALYDSAVRAIENMASTFLGSTRAYASGHQEIEQALMRLYGMTGDTRYLQLCGWLIAQRGHHEGRPSFGKYSQDHVPLQQQRTIEGHAVRAAFFFNGVTEYVGATGDASYRKALLAVWDDFVNHKMYLHGAGGLMSAQNEGYSSKPSFIPPNDCYGETCSVFGNFQWAHNLFRLTGEAHYLDVSERMVYNALYASLSEKGDRYFYHNVMQKDEPTLRFAWHSVPCCPPNIVKLFSKVGGFFYSTDRDGIFIKHYGASQADIPHEGGIKLIQSGNYPWDGDIGVQVDPKSPTTFTLRLRIPGWAKSHAVHVNDKQFNGRVEKGWVVIRRRWKAGDRVQLSLPMSIERVTMPPRFKEYAGLVALQRGPIVYCIEEEDVGVTALNGYLPAEAPITAEYRPDLLGGITVLRTGLQLQSMDGATSSSMPATFIPYGVWNNRTPGAMRVWLRSKPAFWETLAPKDPPGADDNGR